MQIRLSHRNTQRLSELMEVYRKTCLDYDLSATQQANLLLAGRLDVAIKEAKCERKKLNGLKS